ncbi:MAG TPA: hypothetical protein PK916_06980 [Bacteroidota bacterium]|nr:hypothetical protein [Bacteroidota bacterium]
MTSHGTISSRRCPEHDYSAPGTYYLELPVREESPPLLRKRNGRITLTEEGMDVLHALGETLHRQGRHVRLDALDVRPTVVVLLLTVLSSPRVLRRLLLAMSAWLYRRRMALIPLFVGHVKMNSARRINARRGTGGSYWCEGYRDRVVYDAVEAAAMAERVGMAFGDVLFRDAVGEERSVEGLILGWAYVLELPSGELTWHDADSCIRGCAAVPINDLPSAASAPLSGRAGPHICVLGAFDRMIAP